MNNIEVYQVTHSSPELTTLKEYLGEVNSPGFQYVKEPDKFLQIKGENGTNEDMINLLLSPGEQEENKKKDANSKKIKVGTNFYIPVSKISTSALLTSGIEVTSNNVPAFKAKQLLQLESDEQYRSVLSPQASSILDGKLVEHHPKATVWIWCRGLSRSYSLSGQVIDELEGQIVDLSPFLQKLSTTVSKNGGNFQISLPPITCSVEYVNDQNNKVNPRWVLSDGDITIYSESLSDNDVNYLQQSLYYKEAIQVEQFDVVNNPSFGSEYLIRQQFYFHNIISTNDLVFIRFNTLEMEKEQRYQDQSQLLINKDKLAGRIYDMIGLVDSNTLTTNPQSIDVSISVTGRDLIKLFIDDGTYSYNLENITGQTRIAGEGSRENELMRRLAGDNTLYYLNLYQNTSIEHVLKFIIQQLSSIRITPNELFESYGYFGREDRRNRRYTDKTNLRKSQNNNQKIEELKKKVFSSIQLAQFEPSGVIEVIYTKLHDFLIQIREKKKRIIGGNKTLGWEEFIYQGGVNESLKRSEIPNFLYEANLICNENTFSPISTHQQGLKDIINQVDEIIDFETSQNKSKDEVKWDEEVAKGIWQIIKLVIDRGVTNRRIVDSSMSSANGSLLNFIKKVCQEPFVEFYSDTYGDLFYLIARKPPFDKQGILSLLDGRIEDEDGTSKYSSPVITITPEEVLREDLSFDDREVYSWYSFRPQNVYMGGGSVLPAAYTPAIYFEEYAKIWGSRPLELVHNYNPYLGEWDEEKGVPDISRYEEQAILDLKYLIESHCYLPFTRKGSIVVNLDRRLKRGNLVRYLPTGEIFYIDSVSHSYSISEQSIDSTTTLQVSRGMVEQYIYGIELNNGGTSNTNYSYFNIINTDFKISKKQYNEEYEEEVESTIQETQQSNNSNTKVIQGEEIQIRPGFNEYIQHQQGAGGAKQIILAAKNDTKVSGDIQKNMVNQGIVKSGPVTPRTFLKALILYYNKKYDEAQSPSKIDYYYVEASKKEKVPLDSLRTMGYIESSHGLDKGSGTYYGVMQLSQSVANEVGVNRYDDFQNILGGARYMKRHQKNKLIGSSFVFEPVTTEEIERKMEVVEKKVTTKVKKVKKYIGIDLEEVYSNLKVNQEVFNFFLRKSQFETSQFVRIEQQSKHQGTKTYRTKLEELS